MTTVFSVVADGEVAGAAADVVADVLQQRPDAVIGFPTGSTPRGLYRELAERVHRGELDFSAVTAVALDEYLRVRPADPRSFTAYLQTHVLTPLAIADAILLDGTPAVRSELDLRCRAHEDAIAAAGGVDLQIVGIGRNGHLAFNEPGTSFETRTHVSALTPGTRLANSAGFAPAEVPTASLTQGLATIAAARTILLVATGDDKADAVAAAFDGPVDPSCPASLLQRHPDVRAVLDPTAASSLSRRGRGLPTVLETHA